MQGGMSAFLRKQLYSTFPCSGSNTWNNVDHFQWQHKQLESYLLWRAKHGAQKTVSQTIGCGANRGSRKSFVGFRSDLSYQNSSNGHLFSWISHSSYVTFHHFLFSFIENLCIICFFATGRHETEKEGAGDLVWAQEVWSKGQCEEVFFGRSGREDWDV